MSDGGGAATRGAHGSTARDDGRPHRVVADAQFGTDLDQSEAADIQAGYLFTNRLWQGRHAGFDAGPPRDLADSAAMHLEVGGELANRHSVGVGSEQSCSIRGTQTGLSLSRIFAHRATLIGDPRAWRGAPTTP